MQIPLVNRHGTVLAYALVDDTDSALAQHRWLRDTHGYAYRYERNSEGRQVRIMMHREILGLPRHPRSAKSLYVDHINRNFLDNRKANLRLVTHAQNMQNRKKHKNGRSPYRGVQWDTSKNRWRGEIKINGKRVWSKRFKDVHQAGAETAAKRLELMPYAID